MSCDLKVTNERASCWGKKFGYITIVVILLVSGGQFRGYGVNNIYVHSKDVPCRQFAFVTRWPYCPGRPKKLCFTTPSLTPMVFTARLGVVKQSFFGLRGQYGRRVTKANEPHKEFQSGLFYDFNVLLSMPKLYHQNFMCTNLLFTYFQLAIS